MADRSSETALEAVMKKERKKNKEYSERKKKNEGKKEVTDGGREEHPRDK